MVCENHTRDEVIEILSNLRKINTNNHSYAAKYDNSISKGTNVDLCVIIKLYMLYFEEKSGKKWIYLFHNNIKNN